MQFFGVFESIVFHLTNPKIMVRKTPIFNYIFVWCGGTKRKRAGKWEGIEGEKESLT